MQDELDRRPGEDTETELKRDDEAFIEIAGVRLSPIEVERRIDAAFDRLVRRSLNSGPENRALPAQSPAAVKDE